jgi:RimJ/RimL family protein N-acetyltransferase
VETEQDALKSYSIRRIQLMMQENLFSFAVQLLQPLLEMPDSGSPLPTTNSEGPVIGFIGITSPPQIFYIFDQPYWGFGYASETLSAFLDAYWNMFPMGLKDAGGDIRDYLEGHVNAGNVASERVLEKNGFRFVREETTNAHGREVGSRIWQLKR